MKPLLLTALGRTISAAPLGRRGDDVEVRRIPALPTARALDPDRPTVIMLDRALVGSAGDGVERLEELASVAALVGIGDPGELEPPERMPKRPPGALFGITSHTRGGLGAHRVCVLAPASDRTERCVGAR